jgi:hypothetical protein
MIMHDQLTRLRQRAHVHTENCYGAYAPCGEHHMHDATCGSRPCICRMQEDPDLVELLAAYDRVEAGGRRHAETVIDQPATANLYDLRREVDHASSVAQLEAEGRRLAEAAIDHPAAASLRPAISQALRCLDRGIELSWRACSEINHFAQLHRNADGPLGDCAQGLDWLRLRLAARDSVRSIRIARWVRYIQEHSTKSHVIELGNALDAGLRAFAMDEPLDEQHRNVLMGWLAEPEREPAYTSAVQQILRL